MITFLLSEVGYTNDCLFLSLVLWTFPNNELNHSLCRKGFKNQYCKSQRQKDRAEAHIKCQTALSQLKRKSFRQGYRFKNAGLANTSQSSHLEQVGSQLMPEAMPVLPRGSTWPPHKEDMLPHRMTASGWQSWSAIQQITPPWPPTLAPYLGLLIQSKLKVPEERIWLAGLGPCALILPVPVTGGEKRSSFHRGSQTLELQSLQDDTTSRNR